MNESQTIESRKVGFTWDYSREVESVTPVEGSRASNKITEKFSVGGNTETYAEAFLQMRRAKKEVGEVTTQ